MGISVWASRFINTDKDYFLAGRSLGVGIATFSIFATWFGAETCVGSSGAIFNYGLSGSRAEPFGYTICLMLAAYFLASRLWKLNITTLGDLFRMRYSGFVERLAAIVLIPTSLIWAAAQIKAFGFILSVATDIDPGTAIILATLFVITYTSLGGLMADVITDVIQGSLLVLGLLAILVFTFYDLGGPLEALALIEPAQLSFIGEESFLTQLDRWMIPILGSLVAQELIARMLASRSAQVAMKATCFAAMTYFFIGLVPITLGLLGPHYLQVELAYQDLFLPTLAKSALPTSLYILFTGAIISAILSTIDSALLAVSAFATHNLFGESYRKLSSKKKLWVARLLIVVGGLVSYVIAVSSDTIYEMIEMASSFGSAGILVITFMGLYGGKIGGPRAASYTLVTGVLTSFFYDEGYLNLQAPYISSILTSLAIFLFVSYFEGQKKVISRTPSQDVVP